jgi:lipoate-protein ligase A
MPSALTVKKIKTSAYLQLIVDEPGEARYNMDRDVSLFEQGDPVLRFYSWKEKSFSIGYFQSCDEVRKNLPPEDQQCPMVKRITGGGVVEHGNDLTFSIILPKPEEWGMGKTRESYFKINTMILEALKVLGPLPSWERRGEGEQTPGSRIKGQGSRYVNDLTIKQNAAFLHEQEYKPAAHDRKSYFCFQKPTIYDVMLNGIKIGGGAQRRARGTLLHQGSLRIQCNDRSKHTFIGSFYARLTSLKT